MNRRRAIAFIVCFPGLMAGFGIPGGPCHAQDTTRGLVFAAGFDADTPTIRFYDFYRSLISRAGTMPATGDDTPSFPGPSSGYSGNTLGFHTTRQTPRIFSNPELTGKRPHIAWSALGAVYGCTTLGLVAMQAWQDRRHFDTVLAAAAAAYTAHAGARMMRHPR